MFVYHVHIWCSRGQMRVLDVLELGSQLLAVSWVLGPKPRSAARWLTVKNSNLAPSIPFCYLTVGRRKTGFPCIFISGFLCRSGGTQTPFWLLRSHHFLFFVGVWLHQSSLCSHERKHRAHWLSPGECLTGHSSLRWAWGAGVFLCSCLTFTDW